MSIQSFSQKPDDQRSVHFPSDLNSFSKVSSQQLAQFTYTTASDYHPKLQIKASTYSSGSGSNTTAAFHQVKVPALMSDFAASAYAAAQDASKSLQPPVAQPVDLDTFKGLNFITLDSFQIETRDIYDTISGTFLWEMCADSVDRCISHIRENCVNKRVFLIASGSLGKKAVPEIHNLPQVYAIYIYCADVIYHQEWATNYSKIRVVCNDDDKYLLPQFAVDVAQANIDWGNALLKKGDGGKAKEKFQKALDNLNNYAQRPDATMVNQVKSKLEQCK